MRYGSLVKTHVEQTHTHLLAMTGRPLLFCVTPRLCGGSGGGNVPLSCDGTNDVKMCNRGVYSERLWEFNEYMTCGICVGFYNMLIIRITRYGGLILQVNHRKRKNKSTSNRKLFIRILILIEKYYLKNT